VLKELFKSHIFKCRKKIHVFPVEHHVAHAAAAYYTSGFDKALVLTVDGSGDNIATTISCYSGNKMELLRSLDLSQSLGYFYLGLAIYLGFDIWDEGKVMGLASYGTPKREIPIRLTSDGYEIDIPYPVNGDTEAVIMAWIYHFTKLFGPQPSGKYKLNSMKGYISKEPIQFTQEQKDIAASAQYTLEKVLLHLIKVYVKKTECRKVILTGGVALNCSANGSIQRSGLVDDLYIMPAPNDAGGCIGSAMVATTSILNIPLEHLPTPYWGPKFSDSEIKDLLDGYNLKYEYCNDITQRVAYLLAENKVVGWFQNEGEMGPRALGNRSIVASPMTKEMYNRVNKEVKYREHWRPLAPSILDEKRDWLLKDACFSPYMLKAFNVKDNVKDKVPAIVHVDGTTRPQTIRRLDNELWYDLINSFNQLTGVPLVMNTSLNVKGKPICGSPFDAIQTFYSCGMDILVLGNYLLTK
jgi:carbamoyltransferase